MIKIAVIPIDNRPICYNLIQDVLNQNTSVKLFLPKREHLGGLVKNSRIDELYNFILGLEKCDYLIISLDTLIWGGLVSSRRCPDSINEAKERIKKFSELIKQKADKVYAFSSIMRISNNNINEEEKIYWKDWGKKIFEYSYNLHKAQKEMASEPVCDIPNEIIKDYLETRKRNFEVNKLYLELAQNKTLDTLVFSKDDTGKYGLNVKEAEFFEEEIIKRGLKNVFVKTGADEIPLSLITRALCDGRQVKVKPEYTFLNSADKISKYEDISVKNCVENQIALAGCTVSDNPDLVMLVNNFKEEQGDLVLGDVVNNLQDTLKLPQNPYFIADINNANGADSGLIEQLISKKRKNLYGYSGYNTSANTIGSTLFFAVTKFLAKKADCYNDLAFKKFMFIRLIDDWAYQAHVRKPIREAAPEFEVKLKELLPQLKEYETKAAKFLEFTYNSVNYSLPWDRSFEVEINVD